eukprot:621253-Pyramimonas_sp.AAC.1
MEYAIPAVFHPPTAHLCPAAFPARPPLQVAAEEQHWTVGQEVRCKTVDSAMAVCMIGVFR